MRPIPLSAATLLALALSRAPLAAAADPPALPPAAREAGIDERPGSAIDKSLQFTDMDGRSAPLAEHFDGVRPVLLVLAYYRCPTLCGLVLRGLVSGMAKLDYRLGDQYRALTVSFDPRDTPDAAARKRRATLSSLGALVKAGAPAPDVWPFLTGEPPELRALAGDLGFRAVYDAQTDQYAHPAAVFVLTPDGRISRYLYGIEFSALDLRLALLEASRGQVGTTLDRVLMTCYRYDPASRRYGPYVAGFLRLGAAGILTWVVALLAFFGWRGWRHRKQEGAR
ncbi:SCO family protein [Sorangium sp. So ce291]|uniref:SCO family protein n=1 Tax=Sorangium sp. So ce291 TaxID=3133294 RepID=UPI003F64534D